MTIRDKSYRELRRLDFAWRRWVQGRNFRNHLHQQEEGAAGNRSESGRPARRWPHSPMGIRKATSSHILSLIILMVPQEAGLRVSPPTTYHRMALRPRRPREHISSMD